MTIKSEIKGADEAPFFIPQGGTNFHRELIISLNS